MARPRGSRPRRGAALAGVLTACLVAGCSYSADEPGLFDRDGVQTDDRADERTDRSDRSDDPKRVRDDRGAQDWLDVRNDDRRTNPALPVVGEEVWTTADGTRVTVRVAVHAVRRIEGATVLDWSVTPLTAPGARVDDVVPPVVNLGLHRFDAGNTNLFLIDAERRALYRPVVHRNISRRCLCTPVWRAQRALRIGQTALLQVGFPELPPEVTSVDVDIATVPVFPDVPVSPVGAVPMATEPTQLNRPAGAHLEQPERRLVGDAIHLGQRFRIEVARVAAREQITSLQWVITSISGGSGLETADRTPFADPGTPIDYNPIAASGPRLDTGRGVLQASLVSSALTSDRTVECLCSDLRIWARSLREGGHEATVITNFPPLPAGVDEVVVRIPGVGGQRVPVTRDAGLRRSGPPERRRVAYWQERESPQSWSPHSWPTAVPDRAQLIDYLQVRDRFLR